MSPPTARRTIWLALSILAACGDSSTSPDAGSGAPDGAADGGGGVCDGVPRAQPSEWMAWLPTPVSPPDAAYQVATDTVVDTQTCLEWQRAITGAPVSWPEADAACAALELGGHTDWRLPTAIELQSILDRGRAEPAINPTAFPGTPATVDDNWYWTQTAVATDPVGYAWAVTFLRGASTPSDRAGGNYVRCVRGAAASLGADAPADRYTLADQTATDTVTGLSWIRTAAALTWSAAADSCQALDLDGASWRLPTIVELESVVDLGRSNWALDPTAFPQPDPTDALASDHFWAGDDDVSDAADAWAIDFYNGNSKTRGKDQVAYARCVH